MRGFGNTPIRKVSKFMVELKEGIPVIRQPLGDKREFRNRLKQIAQITQQSKRRDGGKIYGFSEQSKLIFFSFFF